MTSVVHKGFFKPWTFDPLIHSYRAIHEAAVFRARNPQTRCGCVSCLILAYQFAQSEGSK